MWKHSILLMMSLALVLGGTAYGAYNPLSDPALIGWWACDEGEGSVVADSSPNGNNGEFVNGDPAWTTGVYGMAVELEGPTLVEIPAVGITLDAATWAGWILPYGTQPDWSSFIMHRGPGPATGFNIVAGNQLAYHWSDASNTWSYRSGVVTPADEWSHAAVTVAPDVATFYLNGVASATNSVSHPSVSWDGPFWLGGDGNSDWVARRMVGALDDVAFFSRVLTAEEIVAIMAGASDPTQASNPTPANEATDVPRDDDLSWIIGEGATSHDVYFGTSLDDVNDGAGTLVSSGQAAASYDPGRLEFGQTYYWRVDEKGGPDGTVKGDVWSFTVEPFAYAIENILVTSDVPFDADNAPENIVNGSGLNSADQHSVNAPDMWLGQPAPGETPTLSFEFDGVYKLYQLQVWNYNVMFEPMLGFGLKDVTIEYSENGTDWTALGDVQFAQATARADYTANTTVDFDGAAAKYVKISVINGYGGLGQYGLSEVRFLYIPVQAREPQPADGDTGTSVATDLSWRSGREAASHEVSLGTDPDALTPADTTSTASYTPGALDLETTYYWQVTEVNDAEAVTAWPGSVWTFTTQEFLVVDDFEGYTDDIDAGEAIFQTWIDGWVNDTGATVGYLMEPFAETSTVNNGRQAMPLVYDNAGVGVAEAELELSQDWTASNVQSLSLYFHGADDNTGQLYLKINGTRVDYSGDSVDITRGQWQPWIVDLATVGANLSSVTSLIIGVDGANAAGTLYIDDIRLYPKTPEYVTPVQPDAAGLVLHYALDEGSGSTVADSSGNGNNGTIEGAPAWITGVSGSALGFDGSRDYIGTGVALLDSLPEFTIACWLKGDLSLGNRSGLVGQNDCVEYGVISANTIQIWTPGGGSLDYAWPYGADTDWHSIIAVGDGQSLTIYMDGKPAITGGTPVTDNYGTSNYTVNIGGGGIQDATDNWFTGDIDEIYIYQRALSAAEVAGLAGLTGTVTIPF